MLKVVLVGRPNVGKSTLFNRLVRFQKAIVNDKPGVTRDRKYGQGILADLNFILIDTAGIDDSLKGNTEIKFTTSILDYIFKELAISYLGRDDLSNQESNQTTELLPHSDDLNNKKKNAE